MLRRRTLLATGAALLGTRSSYAAEPLPTLHPGTLTIGTYFVNPPFEFIKNGARVGYEVDLMDELCKRLNLKPNFINTRWEVILQEMRDHRYDCIIGGITITPNREKTLDWSTPYLTTTLSLVVNTTKTPNIQHLADFKTAIVGVQAATTDYDIAIKMQQEGQIGKVAVYPFAHIEDAIKDLEAGKITAVMKVEPVAAYLASQMPDLKIIAQVPNDPQPLGIGFTKTQHPLKTAVNTTLTAMQSDGFLNHLAQTWGILS